MSVDAFSAKTVKECLAAEKSGEEIKIEMEMSYLLYVRSAARDYRVPQKNSNAGEAEGEVKSRARATGRQEETGINLLKAMRKELCKQISPNKHFNE